MRTMTDAHFVSKTLDITAAVFFTKISYFEGGSCVLYQVTSAIVGEVAIQSVEMVLLLMAKNAMMVCFFFLFG